MVLIAVEALPAGSTPPAAVRVRNSAGEKHGSSSLEQGRAGGQVKLSPKLVRQVGTGLSWAEELSLLITRSAATSSVRLRVFLSDGTSASMA